MGANVQCEELEKMVLGSDEEKYFQVGTQLPLDEKTQLLVFLRNNLDVFAWSAYEAPRVDPDFICHHLKVNLVVVLRKQQPRQSSKEHADAVKEEVNKLKKARSVKKVFYPEWLANTIIVKKKTSKWKVTVDFTDLNKACPKDPFLILRIDQLVNATFGHH